MTTINFNENENENENKNVKINNLYLQNKQVIDYIKQSAHEIYNTLGPGYKEHIYVTALNIHLQSANYLFNNEVIVPIVYKNIQLGYERADIIIYEPCKIILEFKSQNNKLSNKEIQQLQKYLKNHNNGECEIGIVLNFNNNLEFIIADKENKFIE